MVRERPLELDGKGSDSPFPIDSSSTQRSLGGVFVFNMLASSVIEQMGSAEPRSTFKLSSR